MFWGKAINYMKLSKLHGLSLSCSSLTYLLNTYNVPAMGTRTIDKIKSLIPRNSLEEMYYLQNNNKKGKEGDTLHSCMNRINLG